MLMDEGNGWPARWRARAALAALAYAALAAHLLFIPYDYAPLAFDEGFARFARIPWMALGSDQNVALVSRALTLLPLGLLLSVALVPRAGAAARLAAALAAIALGIVCAVAINFAQLWFPARTVSLNNVAAQSAGVTIGALAWALFADMARMWWRELAAGGRWSLRAVLGAYVLLYLFASLAPFDFVTNSAELAEKLASSNYAWWVIASGCGRIPCSIKYLVALAAVIPCGWWFAGLRPGMRDTTARAAVVAIAVSLLIELLRLLMVSGVSQGATVLVRVLGFVLGAQAYMRREVLSAVDWNRYARPAVLAFVPMYLLAIAFVAGWLRADFTGLAEGIARLDDFAWMPARDYRDDVIVWLPFYYQYFEGYQSTMHSTMLHGALYAPVGVVCWLWARHRARVPIASAAMLAAVLALAAETSKIFLIGRHPDYTDVLIAIAAAVAVLAVLRLVSRAHDRGFGGGAIGADPGRSEHSARSASSTPDPWAVGRQRALATPAVAATSGFARFAGALALALAAWTVVDFPLWRWQLGFGLVAYAAVLTRKPAAYLIALPALLALLDLAPWSGRFYWDEFDALLMTTLGTRLLAGLPAARFKVNPPKFAIGLLLLSVVISTAIGVWPLAPLDTNAFANYLSEYNALRVAKGYVWAALLLWLIQRDAASGRWSIQELGTTGLALGLAAAAAGVFWERLSFLGAAGLDASFRAAGFVSATHVGGAYLEAILVILAPFALAVAVGARPGVVRALGAVVFVAGAMALLMTISRAAVAAWVVAVAIFLLVWWWRVAARAAVAARTGLARGLAAVLVVAIAAIAIAAQSDYLRERFGKSAADLSYRAAHWRAALELIPSDATHLSFGMGLGSFPRQFYLARASDERLRRLSSRAGRRRRAAAPDPGRRAGHVRRPARRRGPGRRVAGERTGSRVAVRCRARRRPVREVVPEFDRLQHHEGRRRAALERILGADPGSALGHEPICAGSTCIGHAVQRHFRDAGPGRETAVARWRQAAAAQRRLRPGGRSLVRHLGRAPRVAHVEHAGADPGRAGAVRRVRLVRPGLGADRARSEPPGDWRKRRTFRRGHGGVSDRSRVRQPSRCASDRGARGDRGRRVSRASGAVAVVVAVAAWSIGPSRSGVKRAIARGVGSVYSEPLRRPDRVVSAAKTAARTMP